MDVFLLFFRLVRLSLSHEVACLLAWVACVALCISDLDRQQMFAGWYVCPFIDELNDRASQLVGKLFFLSLCLGVGVFIFRFHCVLVTLPTGPN